MPNTDLPVLPGEEAHLHEAEQAAADAVLMEVLQGAPNAFRILGHGYVLVGAVKYKSQIFIFVGDVRDFHHY